MAKKDENIISFIDETLYTDYTRDTWWNDSGTTIHVANSLQGFRSTRTMQRNERQIKVANGVLADVEAVGDILLTLTTGYVFILRDVFYVLTLERNLIRVSRLDDDGFDCQIL